MEINWTKYTDMYPDRYIKESKIDDEIRKLISNPFSHLTPKTLDIGGNINGTQVLRTTNCFFLDPHIKKPNWYEEQITWDDVYNIKHKFDIIVAKNSFNYLTEKELKSIPHVLNKGGVFIANTFIKPTEINRGVCK